MNIKDFKTLVDCMTKDDCQQEMRETIRKYITGSKVGLQPGTVIGRYTICTESYDCKVAFILKTNGEELIREEVKGELARCNNIGQMDDASANTAIFLCQTDIDKCWNAFVGRIAQEEVRF